MYKIIEQFRSALGKIVYTILDDNNDLVDVTTSKLEAESIIKNINSFEGDNEPN